MPLEQARWTQSNIDSLFHAGCQQYVNNYMGGSMGRGNSQSYYFNLIQQPCNLITGYERQHRKQFLYQPSEGSDAQTTDQYSKLIAHVANMGSIHEVKSKAKEQALISAMVMAQPYLDYTGEDQAQGELKVKLWEFNAFMTDPYFRNLDMSDATFFWAQEYITRKVAEERFGEKANNVSPMSTYSSSFNNFYFLPEAYNMAKNNLLIVSYVWYKGDRLKKRLYSKSRNLFYDYAGEDGQLDEILMQIPDLEPVTVKVPTWKLCTVLNDQLMFQGDNPLKHDMCPVVPYVWNYDPHIGTFPDLRCRSLVRTLRDPQYLFNFKIINNNDIAVATLNNGYKRKSGAVANEDNLKKVGQGYDIIINEGYEMTDVEKIIPTGVPESDLALAQQMSDLLFQVSGIQMENWTGENDKNASSLSLMMKQAATLTIFQKYFDQWDYADKLLGQLLLQIVLYNWNAEKVKSYINEEPSPFFYNKMFSKTQVLVEEADLTPTQQNLQAQQMLDINQMFGREVFPPSMVIPKLNITGKGEIIPFLEQQEQQMAAVQSEATNIQHAFEEAKLKEMMSKATANIARAREDHSRSESNLGLYEERLSMIERNRALSLKEKQAALTSLLENISRFGEIETAMKQNELESLNFQQIVEEEHEKMDVERRTSANKFLTEIMGSMNTGNQQSAPQEAPM